MIEIVRNAVTIAAIQRSLGGTTGAFTNDALYEWLKSKGPLQEIVSNTDEQKALYKISHWVIDGFLQGDVLY